MDGGAAIDIITPYLPALTCKCQRKVANSGLGKSIRATYVYVPTYVPEQASEAISSPDPDPVLLLRCNLQIYKSADNEDTIDRRKQLTKTERRGEDKIICVSGQNKWRRNNKKEKSSLTPTSSS